MRCARYYHQAVAEVCNRMSVDTRTAKRALSESGGCPHRACLNLEARQMTRATYRELPRD